MRKKFGFAAACALVGALAVCLAFGANLMDLRGRVAKALAANYRGQDLTGRNFTGKKLAYANLSGANCTQAEFADADLRHADLSQVNFTDAGITGADCSFAKFDGAILKFARGQECADYRNASFRKTDLSNSSFHGTGGSEHRSKPHHWLDPQYGGAAMHGAIFEGSNCQRAFFNRCTLAGANFRDCDCREADFSDADCRNADFTNADLREAKFDGADTTGAIFTNARRK